MEIEADLMAALDEARAQYQAAREQYRLAVRTLEDLGLNHPDGNVALQLAVSRQAGATECYRKALVRFTRFILDGKTAANSGTDDVT